MKLSMGLFMSSCHQDSCFPCVENVNLNKKHHSDPVRLLLWESAKNLYFGIIIIMG